MTDRPDRSLFERAILRAALLGVVRASSTRA